METLVLKTNINCGKCVAKVTPFFNENFAIKSWEVDTQNPDKILTIKGQITENQALELIEKAGFIVKETLQSSPQNEFLARYYCLEKGRFQHSKLLDWLFYW